MRSLLFVEDNELLTETAVTALTDAGLEVLAIRDAESALALLGQHQFDAAIVDTHLAGGVSGIELARRILELRPIASVVLTTAYDTSKMSLPKGIKILQKPYRFDDLMLAVTGESPPVHPGTAEAHASSIDHRTE